jgi:seryl-tRNA synthetase
MVEKVMQAAALRGAGIDPEYFALAASYMSQRVQGVRWAAARESFAIDYDGAPAELEGLVESLLARLTRSSLRRGGQVLWSRAVAELPARGAWEALVAGGAVRDFGGGHLGYGGPLLDLVEALDGALLGLALRRGAERLQLPQLLPLDLLRRLGVFDHYPQHLFFAAPLRPDLAEIEEFRSRSAAGDPPIASAQAAPRHGLKTSACAPIYPTLQGTDSPGDRLFTTVATCTRHEAGNVRSLERLTEFRMREIVYAGDAAGAEAFRRRCVRVFQDLFEVFDLAGAVVTARDAFFVAGYEQYGTAQLLSGDKLEARAAVPESGAEIAVASFNYHRDYFSKRFAFTVRGAPAATACVGFGLERLAYAVLARHGAGADLSGPLRALAERFDLPPGEAPRGAPGSG